MKDNIILIGFMGCGKSTLGKHIAHSLDMVFIDTDEYIEVQEGMTISAIFKLKGEKYFREVEAQSVKDISKLNNVVISTGGGVANSPINMNMLKRNGVVFFLDCTIQCLVERLSRTNDRPLLNGAPNLKKRVVELLNQRRGNYERAKDFTIAIDSDSSVWDSVEEIKKIYITKG